jgi:hypothetical protein
MACLKGGTMADQKQGVSIMKILLIVLACGCLLVVIGAGLCVFVCGTAVHQAAEEMEKEQIARDKAPVSKLTWEEIDKIYNLSSDYTDLQKTDNWKKYKGKKVKWTGIVTEVSETLGMLHLHVKMNDDSMGSDVLVRIKDAERQKAAKLKQGDEVTFIGILENWGSLMPVTLTNGKIVAE